MSLGKRSGEDEPRRRVLVVDDETELCGLYAVMLHGLGYLVQTATTARRALDVIRAEPPDLVLLDLHLPDCSGQDVLELIRADARTRFLPVILMTGDPTRDHRLRALKAGVSDFLAKPLDAEELLVRIHALLQIKSLTDDLEQAADVITALANMIEARDLYTAGHSERVAGYAVRLGEQIDLPARDLAALKVGARFHDVGKLAIRDDVLLKAGSFTDDERADMRRHPVEGWRMIGHLQSLAATRPLVLSHHERMDGSGYPDGLAGAAIPVIVRVMSVADVFDALTTRRPYRAAFPPGDALAIMRGEAGKGWWDPELVAAFAALIEACPGGSAAAQSPWLAVAEPRV